MISSNGGRDGAQRDNDRQHGDKGLHGFSFLNAAAFTVGVDDRCATKNPRWGAGLLLSE
jgi:hypothetical protein